MALRDIADGFDGGHVPVHRVDGLERDHPGTARLDGGQLAFEVRDVVVGKNRLVRHSVADPRDHGGVVPGVGDEDAAGKLRADGGQGRLVRRVSGGEEEGGLLAVKIRELALQQHMVVRGAGDVAGAAGARAVPVDRLLHRGAHDLVLTHSEVVVRAPDRDLRGADGEWWMARGNRPARRSRSAKIRYRPSALRSSMRLAKKRS